MTPPKRQLGLSITAALVIANMIGTGVFTGAGFQAHDLHDPITMLLTWVVGGVLALCGAAAYAELGSMMPRAGGEYVYLREAYHPAVGAMSGWVSLTAGFSAPIAAAALVYAAYVARLVPGLDGAPLIAGSIDIGGHHIVSYAFGPQQQVAIGLILFVTAIHAFDTKVGGWVQTAFTACKVALIVLFIVMGLVIGSGDWSHFHSQHGGLSNVGTKSFAMALMYVAFSYSGWNAAAYIASDVKNPAKTLPRALFLGTGVVMVLYVLLNLVFLYAVPSDVLAGPTDSFKPVLEVGDLAARNLFGNGAGRFVSSVIALALVSAVSAMVMAGPRVYAAMAADRALPKQLMTSTKRGVPIVAILAQSVLGILFVIFGDPDALIRFVGFTLSISAALTVSGLFVLRRRGVHSQYRTWGYPATPIAFIALSVWIAYAQISARPVESLAIIGVLGLGGLAYWRFAPKPDPARQAEVGAGPPLEESLPEARVVSDSQA